MNSAAFNTVDVFFPPSGGGFGGAGSGMVVVGTRSYLGAISPTGGSSSFAVIGQSITSGVSGGSTVLTSVPSASTLQIGSGGSHSTFIANASSSAAYMSGAYSGGSGGAYVANQINVSGGGGYVAGSFNASSPIPFSNSSGGYSITTAPQQWATTTPATVPTAQTWTVQSFAEDYEDARAPNWDEAGASAVSDDVLGASQAIMADYPSLPAPTEVAPLADGALSFVWRLSAGYLFISIGPGNALHLFYDIPKLGKWERITTLDNADARSRLRSAVTEITQAAQNSATSGTLGIDAEPRACIELLAA